ncbi:MAG: hypothetical protein IPP76_10540 [Moraxellaceae bacterium]|nr:hypothetical protein [Moraxellaceae bacterium]
MPTYRASIADIEAELADNGDMPPLLGIEGMTNYRCSSSLPYYKNKS